MNRRALLKSCSLAAAGLALADRFASPADAEEVSARLRPKLASSRRRT